MSARWAFFWTLLMGFMFMVLMARLSRPYEAIDPSPPAPIEVQGLWFDSDRWSAISMPDSAVACRWQGVTLRCIPLPPGSVLLIPQGR